MDKWQVVGVNASVASFIGFRKRVSGNAEAKPKVIIFFSARHKADDQVAQTASLIHLINCNGAELLCAHRCLKRTRFAW